MFIMKKAIAAALAAVVTLGMFTASASAKDYEIGDTITFGTYEQVQYNAEPVYWQADDAREIKRGQTQYYVLEVNWEQSALSDAVKRSLYKETEMIYVTVATILEAGTETTGGGA